jgi:hypothetical protein
MRPRRSAHGFGIGAANVRYRYVHVGACDCCSQDILESERGSAAIALSVIPLYYFCLPSASPCGCGMTKRGMSVRI